MLGTIDEDIDLHVLLRWEHPTMMDRHSLGNSSKNPIKSRGRFRCFGCRLTPRPPRPRRCSLECEQLPHLPSNCEQTVFRLECCPLTPDSPPRRFVRRLRQTHRKWLDPIV